jgi:type I restriction enzyme S subunit
MHPSEQEMKKLRLQKGDILVNRTNSAELVGKCAVFDLEGDYLFASYIIRIRLDQQKADPRLVAQYINSPAGRAYMFAERKQMTGQANVNSKKLAALPISLPPLDEQRHIVAYLDGLQTKVNALRVLQASTSEELSALMPSILDKAFKGNL